MPSLADNRTIFLPKRGWPRFSVRTLWIMVSILCVWLGWQWRIVEERRAVGAILAERKEWVAVVDPAEDEHPQEERLYISTLRQLLGDKIYYWIELSDPFPPELLTRIEAAFPDARIDIAHGDSRENYWPGPYVSNSGDMCGYMGN